MSRWEKFVRWLKDSAIWIAITVAIIIALLVWAPWSGSDDKTKKLEERIKELEEDRGSPDRPTATVRVEPTPTPPATHDREIEELRKEVRDLKSRIPPKREEVVSTPKPMRGLKTAKIKAAVLVKDADGELIPMPFREGSPPLRMGFWIEVDDSDLEGVEGPIAVEWSFGEDGAHKALTGIRGRTEYVFRRVGRQRVHARIMDANGDDFDHESATVVLSTGEIPTTPVGPTVSVGSAEDRLWGPDRRARSADPCVVETLVIRRGQAHLLSVSTEHFSAWIKVPLYIRYRVEDSPDVGYELMLADGSVFDIPAGGDISFPDTPDGLFRIRGKVLGQKVRITVDGH
ncbi:MAG: hypothetical protein Q8P45_03560 [Candidatus Harrisonbacteria bacterium]|nr:hypothetical protein [Candidatus Harrisonbacteria bacterium]